MKHESLLTRDLEYLEGRNIYFANAARRIRALQQENNNFVQHVMNAPLEVVRDLSDYKHRQPTALAMRVGRSAWHDELTMMKQSEDDGNILKRAINTYYTVAFLKQFGKKGKVIWDVVAETISDLRDRMTADAARDAARAAVAPRAGPAARVVMPPYAPDGNGLFL